MLKIDDFITFNVVLSLIFQILIKDEMKNEFKTLKRDKIIEQNNKNGLKYKMKIYELKM